MSQQVLERPARTSGQETLHTLANNLQQMVASNRRRWKSILLLEGLGLIIAAPLAYLWLVFFLDNQLHLPMAGRLLASLGFVGGLGWIITQLVQRWHRLHLSEDQVALAME